MGWTVRPAGVGDVDALLGVNAEAASAALPREWLQDPSRYNDDRRLLLVAESGAARIDGFCLATLVLDEASLLLIAVRPRAQGRGLGRSLLQALLAALAGRTIGRCLLEVRESNAAALALYRGCGFVRDGRRRGYYADGAGGEREDAILMSWTRIEDHGGT